MLLHKGAGTDTKYNVSHGPIFGPNLPSACVVPVTPRLACVQPLPPCLSNPLTQNGDTPLTLALRNGHTEIAALMLEKGANKDAKDNVSHYSHLTLLIRRYGRRCVLALSRPSHQIRLLQNGDTPLTLALQNGQTEIAAVLLEKGADKDAKGDVSR